MIEHDFIGEIVHYVPAHHVNPKGKHVAAKIIDILDQEHMPGFVELLVFVPSEMELMGNQPIQRIKCTYDKSKSAHTWHYMDE